MKCFIFFFSRCLFAFGSCSTSSKELFEIFESNGVSCINLAKSSEHCKRMKIIASDKSQPEYSLFICFCSMIIQHFLCNCPNKSDRQYVYILSPETTTKHCHNKRVMRSNSCLMNAFCSTVTLVIDSTPYNSQYSLLSTQEESFLSFNEWRGQHGDIVRIMSEWL